MVKQISVWMLAAWCMVSALQLPAAALTTNGGKVYQNVEVKKVADGRVTIAHDGGKAVLTLEELPENFVAALSERQRMALQKQVDLKLTDGRKLEKTVLLELGNQQVVLSHLDGVTEIPAKLLPKAYLVTFTPKQMQDLKQTQRSLADVPGDENDAKSIPPAIAGNANVAAKQNETPAATEVDEKGRTIYTGSRGGRYYLTPTGRKVYLPKPKDQTEKK